MLKNNIRVDKFLWCVRFYKTRTLSKDACNKSKIRINNKIAKSASTINVNDTISIKKREIFYKFINIFTATHPKLIYKILLFN